MKILLEKADFELTVKGSRFIACAQTAESQTQAREILRLTKKALIRLKTLLLGREGKK